MESFLKIKDLATRNLARGLVSSENRSDSKKVMEKIRKKTPSSEMYNVTKFILDNPLHKKIDFQNDSPSIPENLLKWRPFEEIAFEKELMFQVARINSNQELLIKNIQLFANLNKLIHEKKYDETVSIIEEIIEECGYSHALFKKIAYLHVNAKKCEAIENLIKTFIDTDGFKRYSLFYYNFYEIFDPLDEYFKVRNKWDRNTSGLRLLWWKDLFISNLFPFCYSEVEFARRALTYGMISVFDILYLLKIHVNTEHFFEVFPYLKVAEELIANEITTCWNNEYGITFQSDKIILKESEDGFLGNDLYRNSLAFLEYSELSKWRSSIDMYYQSRINSREISTDVSSKLINTQHYFPDTLKLKDLCAARSGFEQKLEIFINNNENVNIRTIAVMHCLSNGQSLVDLNQDDLQLLLSVTTELANLLYRTELEALVAHAKERNLTVISFLAICMLYQSNPNDDLEFDLRAEFQMMLIQGFDADLIQFLDWLHDKTPELTNVIGQLCDIAFIERLYILIDSFSAVLETREKICSWIGDNLNLPEFDEASKRLKIDIKIRDLKGNIDDTRIYIDEIRFKLWAEQNIVDTLRRILRSELAGDIPPISFAKSFGKDADILDMNSSVGSTLWLAQACQEAFDEFCLNKIYGINSYLGRRIRHGTLDGFLLAPIVQLFEKNKNLSIAKNNTFLERKVNWLREYRQIVDHLRDEYLFFKSEEKSEGLFSTNIIETKERTDILTSFCINTLGYLAEGSSVQEVSSQFSAYCWQCLQTDLLNVKRFIQLKTITDVKKLTDKYFKFDTKQEELRQFHFELDQLTTSQLNEFGNWFEKPESVAISATIRELADTVLHEFGGYFPDFNPNLNYSGEIDSKIYGHTYHTLYDCLFVLLGNAAKHGKKDGQISIVAEPVSDNSSSVIKVSITSEYKDEVDHHNSRIKTAMETGDLSSAMVGAGFTGLRKVRKITADEWLLKSFSSAPHDVFTYHTYENQLTFAFLIPMILI